jgi:hypothetical protein
MDLTSTADDATVRVDIAGKGAEVAISTYHWSAKDRHAFGDALILSRTLHGPARRLASLLCATRVVVQLECAETYAVIHITLTTSAALTDVYWSAHAMHDARGAIRQPDLRTRADGELHSTTRPSASCYNAGEGCAGASPPPPERREGGSLSGSCEEWCTSSASARPWLAKCTRFRERCAGCVQCGAAPSTLNATLHAAVPSRLEFAVFATNAHRATLRGRVLHADDSVLDVCEGRTPIHVTTTATVRYTRTIETLLLPCASGMQTSAPTHTNRDG